MELVTKQVSVTPIRKGALATLLTVAPGQAFYADIATENSTGSNQIRDFLAAFGTYDPSTGEFTLYWSHVAENVTISTGTDTDSVDCEAMAMGTWDVLGAIGTYDAGAGTFTIESAVVAEGALTVVGVAVTGVSLHT